jgi:V/A-type H+-transporting ATPase subunit K
MRFGKAAVVLALTVFVLLTLSAFALASSAEGGEAAAASTGRGSLGIIGIGAALAVGLTGLATGLAQSKIGAAGAGAITEKPELMGMVIILLALPETVVIFGFVVAIMIMGLK